ncbi:uncharacterized protein LOC126906842 isoform X2 [Daktulosphaira vitifoliae]|uniref:uncharacterized protein LOC126906842 isoform X2 n=1 Tax=Daktulosphaira vitifoliae TaxID=58002 RepID=UPI0021AAE2B5|nr:uncharacterized protein LOC126906842 isoform X2 [Daktulosphaira vitifoliae]
MPQKKSLFSKFINFIRKVCQTKNKKNCANIKRTNAKVAASGDSLHPIVPSKGTTDERKIDKIQDFSGESNQYLIKNGSVRVKRENGQRTMVYQITDLKESIKREILNDPKLEIIIRNQIQDLTSEFIQEIVQNCLRESTDYLIKNSSSPEKCKEEEINMNEKLTKLKDLRQINDFIPLAPSLFQTLPTLLKADDNIKNKSNIDRPALPINLMNEIKHGVELKPVKPVVKVLEKPNIDEKSLQGMNPLNNFIPPAPPLFQTLPTHPKVDNNTTSKGKIDRLALPMNLLEERKRGFKLKPVKPVDKVIEKAKLDENELGRMNPLDMAMFHRINMMSSSSSSDSSSENSSQDEWD